VQPLVWSAKHTTKMLPPDFTANVKRVPHPTLSDANDTVLFLDNWHYVHSAHGTNSYDIHTVTFAAVDGER